MNPHDTLVSVAAVLWVFACLLLVVGVVGRYRAKPSDDTADDRADQWQQMLAEKASSSDWPAVIEEAAADLECVEPAELAAIFDAELQALMRHRMTGGA